MNTNDPNTAFLQTLAEYHRLGIAEQIDYKKFYLYSIITNSTALEGSSLTEEDNYLLFEDTNSFLTSLEEKTTQKKAKTTQKPQKTTQKILDAISKEPAISRTKLAELCGISPDGVKWQLKKLQGQGKLTHVGPAKGGHWEIISE